MSDLTPPSYTFEVPSYPQVFVVAPARRRPYWLHILLLLLTALTAMFAILLLPWLRLGRGAEVVRSSVHLCGVVDIAAEEMRPGTARLYESPDAILRRALFAPERAAKREEA